MLTVSIQRRSCDVLGFLIRLCHYQPALYPSLVQRVLDLGVGILSVVHGFPIQIKPVTQGFYSLDPDEHWTADLGHFCHRCFAYAGPQQGRVGFMVRPWTQFRESAMPIASIVIYVRPGPGFDQKFFSLGQHIPALIESDSKADVFVLVVGGSPTRANN